MTCFVYRSLTVTAPAYVHARDSQSLDFHIPKNNQDMLRNIRGLFSCQTAVGPRRPGPPSRKLLHGFLGERIRGAGVDYDATCRHWRAANGWNSTYFHMMPFHLSLPSDDQVWSMLLRDQRGRSPGAQSGHVSTAAKWALLPFVLRCS